MTFHIYGYTSANGAAQVRATPLTQTGKGFWGEIRPRLSSADLTVFDVKSEGGAEHRLEMPGRLLLVRR
jgi:hypothetical protein